MAQPLPVAMYLDAWSYGMARWAMETVADDDENKLSLSEVLMWTDISST